ncbi:MAG: helix-turn-helix domain-containing protein [Deltaproteobacteria bacterium]|nr:helix-turn-helix domain-containing protein [Deltaproteobacteria bacterium]
MTTRRKKKPAKPTRRKKLGGRPTKLTAALGRRVIRLVGTGVFLETAAAYAGVSRSTLYEWLRRGAEEAEGLFAEFRAGIDIAVAKAEVHDWDAIGAAAKTDWKAAAWRLSRRHPDRFAQRSAVQVSPSLLKSAEADLSLMSAEDLEAIERIHHKYVVAAGVLPSLEDADEIESEPDSEVSPA